MSDLKNQASEEEDSADPNAVYVQPNIEHELSKDKRQVCRDIIKEIKDYGVNQRQILFLIQLLAVELESREAMTAISRVIGEVRKEIPVGNKLVLTEQPATHTKKLFL